MKTLGMLKKVQINTPLVDSKAFKNCLGRVYKLVLFMSQGRSVFLLVMDTVRYDLWHKTCYCTVHSQPGWIIFHNVYAPSTWTIPSHVSIFTGLYPHEHGAHKRLLPSDVTGLTYHLKRKGYYCILVSANPTIIPFMKGFDMIVEAYDLGKQIAVPRIFSQDKERALNNKFARTLVRAVRFFYYRLRDPAYGERFVKAKGINRILIKIVSKLGLKKPLFAFVNYMDVHNYYMTSNIFSLANPRQAYVCALKRLWRDILDLIRNLNQFYNNNFVVLITSDHGELLGEYGLVSHGHAYVYEELIRVPLIIYDPSVIKQLDVYKIISLKHIFDIVLMLSSGLRGVDVIKKIQALPDFVIFEDCKLGSFDKARECYRAVITPKLTLVEDTFGKVRLRTKNNTVSKDDIYAAYKTLVSVRKQALLRERLRYVKSLLYRDKKI